MDTGARSGEVEWMEKKIGFGRESLGGIPVISGIVEGSENGL